MTLSSSSRLDQRKLGYFRRPPSLLLSFPAFFNSFATLFLGLCFFVLGFSSLVASASLSFSVGPLGSSPFDSWLSLCVSSVSSQGYFQKVSHHSQNEAVEPNSGVFSAPNTVVQGGCHMKPAFETLVRVVCGHGWHQCKTAMVHLPSGSPRQQMLPIMRFQSAQEYLRINNAGITNLQMRLRAMSADFLWKRWENITSY